MKKLLTGLLLSTTLLTGCTTTTTAELQMQVAPNVAPESSCSASTERSCLVVKIQAQGYPVNWMLWPQKIEGFTYEPGYLYDLTVIRTDRRGVIGDPPPASYSLKQVNSKVTSSEVKEPGDS